MEIFVVEKTGQMHQPIKLLVVLTTLNNSYYLSLSTEISISVPKSFFPSKMQPVKNKLHSYIVD